MRNAAVDAAHPLMSRLLQDGLGHLQRLLEILQDEAQRLRDRNIEGLDRLLSDKLATLKALDGWQADHRQLLAGCGLMADPAGMNAFLKHCADEAMATAWERVRQMLQHVQAMNEANGMVIQRGMAVVEQQIALLRGEAPAASGYGPQGKTTRGPRGRKISEA